MDPPFDCSWSDSVVVIGDSGCGDYYSLDLDEVPAVVKSWDHETGEIEEVAASIEKNDS